MNALFTKKSGMFDAVSPNDKILERPSEEMEEVKIQTSKK